jgi:hypothetical protein
MTDDTGTLPVALGSEIVPACVSLAAKSIEARAFFAVLIRIDAGPGRGTWRLGARCRPLATPTV